jgi:hypothetical protein
VKSTRNKKGEAPAGRVLRWPLDWVPTDDRVSWFKSLSLAPAGLTRKEVAARLGVGYSKAGILIRTFGYPVRREPRPQRGTDWDAVDWSADNATIAAQVGVGVARVMQVRFRKGLSGPPRRRISWEGVDWSQTDADIGRVLQVTRERVRQVRRAKGLPPSRGVRREHPS